jgi:hypothetical protein
MATSRPTTAGQPYRLKIGGLRRVSPTYFNFALRKEAWESNNESWIVGI